jgi:hypothetical protein
MSYKLAQPKTSSDGRQYTHLAMIEGKARDINEEDFSALATMSSQSPDRERDEIMADAWEVETFMLHPVLLSSHDYGGGFMGGGNGLMRQIGKWYGVEASDDSLVGRASYMVGRGNAEADWGWELARDGMAAYSVGFIPTREPEALTDEKGHKTGYRFVGQELIECSHVIIPAHPEALQRAFAKGAPSDPAIKSILRRMQDSQDEYTLTHDWRTFTLNGPDGEPVLYATRTSKGVEFELPNGDGFGESFTRDERNILLEAAAGLLESNPMKFAGKPVETETESLEDALETVRAWRDE